MKLPFALAALGGILGVGHCALTRGPNPLPHPLAAGPEISSHVAGVAAVAKFAPDRTARSAAIPSQTSSQRRTRLADPNRVADELEAAYRLNPSDLSAFNGLVRSLREGDVE